MRCRTSFSCTDLNIGGMGSCPIWGVHLWLIVSSLTGFINLKTAGATVGYRAECRTQNPVCIYRWWGFEPLSWRCLDSSSWHLQWEDCGAFRSCNIECPSKCTWIVLQLLNPHSLLCQSDSRYSPHANKRVHACNHERLSPRSFPRIKYHRPIGDGR